MGQAQHDLGIMVHLGRRLRCASAGDSGLGAETPGGTPVETPGQIPEKISRVAGVLGGDSGRRRAQTPVLMAETPERGGDSGVRWAETPAFRLQLLP